MIYILVQIFTVILELLLVVLLFLGGIAGQQLIPDVVSLFSDPINFSAGGKFFAGAGIALIAEAVVLGPIIVLFDIRNTIVSLKSEIVELNRKISGDSTSRLSSIDNQLTSFLREMHSTQSRSTERG